MPAPLRPWLVTLVVLAACSTKTVSENKALLPASSSTALAHGVLEFAPAQAEVPPLVSVVDLLSRPAQYDGRKVKVVGALGVGISGIFVTRDHAKYNLTEYGVALRLESCKGGPFDQARFADLPMYDQQYVQLEGTFSVRVTGHLGEFASGICEPTRISTAGFLSEARAPERKATPSRKGAP